MLPAKMHIQNSITTSEIFLFTALAGLAFFAMNDFGAVLNSFTFIRFRLFQASQVCRNLSNELLI
jgi:hypothetical protein